jgi:hypothetical protein
MLAERYASQTEEKLGGEDLFYWLLVAHMSFRGSRYGKSRALGSRRGPPSRARSLQQSSCVPNSVLGRETSSKTIAHSFDPIQLLTALSSLKADELAAVNVELLRSPSISVGSMV